MAVAVFNRRVHFFLLFSSSAALFLLLIQRSSASTCSNETQLAGFESELSMLQHQLRGVVRVIDNCSFSVRSFDMLAGSNNVSWWAAAGDDLRNLSSGRQISSFSLNRSFSNASFTVKLLPGISFDQFSVVSVWDPATFSDFGHFVLPSAKDSADFNKSRHQEPTMFDNCIALSPKYRLRWTLYNDSIEVGLEAAVGLQYYMAFGWADPKSNADSPSMLLADVAVTGFTEELIPFADDYYITQYSECLLNKNGTVEGVCPDTMYEGLDGVVNNTRLVYAHRRDGVSFVRYRRLLVTEDEKYDVHVKKGANMTVIWALGLIRPPDTFLPYYFPQNHGGPRLEKYGYLTFNVSANVNNCLGPLDAEDKEDQDLIIVDRKTPLTVTSGPAMRYPNPPNPSKVLYINKKEAPLLRVERGVQVPFSIQAGHDVALYITSDSIGGNATVRNVSEVIYFGGQDAEGVPASPTELTWLPDRNTPDTVYYHSVYEPKMGWKIQVVDGGLSDMYNNSVLLDDQQVTFFWTLSKDSISVAARGEKKSGYLAIGLGSGMINSYAYVGWIDSSGKGRVSSYWIDRKDAMNVHKTSENLTYVRCKSENGIITFEFTRRLAPSCSGRIECKNIIDPTTPLKVIWAMGAKWSEDHLTERNMHSVTSGRPVRVLLMRGSAEAEQDLRPVLAVHGFMMFVAWGVLLPGGIMAARYLKHVKGDGWFQLHVYLQYSGLAIVFLGVLFAAAELKGFYITSVHVKFGVTAIVLGCLQPINAYFRPIKPATGEVASTRRIIWEYFHVITGRCAILVGIAALFSGMKHLGHRYDSENVDGLTWALILWILAGSLLVMYLEYLEMKQRRNNRNSFRGDWVLGNSDEDDSADLLQPSRPPAESEPHSSTRMEVQLEPLNR